jgi:hypothetical protein
MNDEPEILASLDQLAGVWATRVDVFRTATDFTLDFTRTDVRFPAEAILVARVALAPGIASKLLRALDASWNEYQRGILPPAIFDEEQP